MSEPPCASPLTKNARHQLIIELVTHHEVHSQGELADLLAAEGVHVTQATLSRDLVELDAVKVRALTAPSSTPCPGRAVTGAPLRPVRSAAAA